MSTMDVTTDIYQQIGFAGIFLGMLYFLAKYTFSYLEKKDYEAREREKLLYTRIEKTHTTLEKTNKSVLKAFTAQTKAGVQTGLAIKILTLAIEKNTSQSAQNTQIVKTMTEQFYNISSDTVRTNKEILKKINKS